MYISIINLGCIAHVTQVLIEVRKDYYNQRQ